LGYVIKIDEHHRARTCYFGPQPKVGVPEIVVNNSIDLSDVGEG